jgi:endonuclease/exonuclease/phosphatase family metal-dependent hydrolase
VDVAALQELQRPQYRAFFRLAGGAFAASSARRDTDNAVVWRRYRWRLMSAATFAIPYFDGHPRRMPIVRLRSAATGQLVIVVNVHTPADTRRFPRQGRWRARALAIERRIVAKESRRGARLLVLGDFNAARAPYCELVVGGPLLAAAGGRSGPPCRPPGTADIDWVLGPRGLQFRHYVVNRSDLVRRTTDHLLLLATAG